MFAEIERKFLFKGNKDDALNLVNGLRFAEIKDYYFNKYTRYRWIKSCSSDKFSCYVGIKGDGTTRRVEEECLLSHVPSYSSGIYSPLLCKTRYYYKYEGHTFEINIYKDIPLILIEVELQREDEELLIPKFCGKEVTEDKNYYNYNIWGEMIKRYGRTYRISESG